MTLIPPRPEPDWAATIPPDLTGPSGRAWRVTPAQTDDPRLSVHVGSWLLHAPASHSWWPWYLMTGLALRDTPGVPRAHRQFEGAEYELLVLALDPGEPIPLPVEAMVGKWASLSPPDQVHQLPHLPGGDATMREILELAALSIVDGLLVPDQDHRGHWRETLRNTVEHITEGGHG